MLIIAICEFSKLKEDKIDTAVYLKQNTIDITFIGC